MQQRTVIDGQQRLTTLQIMLDAIHAEISLVGAEAAAARLEPLVENGKPFQKNPEDKFKDLPFVLIGELMLMVAEEELPESIIVLSTRLMLETELPRLIGCPVVFKVPARIKLPVPAIAVTPLVKVVKLLAFLPKETPAVFVKVVAVSTAVLFWKLTA